MDDAERLAELRHRYCDIIEAFRSDLGDVKEARNIAREMQVLRDRMKREESEEPEIDGSAVQHGVD